MSKNLRLDTKVDNGLNDLIKVIQRLGKLKGTYRKI